MVAYGTGDIPFVRTSDIANFEISIDPTKSISQEVYEKYAVEQNLKSGDILMDFCLLRDSDRAHRTSLFVKFTKCAARNSEFGFYTIYFRRVRKTD